MNQSPRPARLAPLVLALAAVFAGPALAQQNNLGAAPDATFTVNHFVVTGDNPMDNDRTQEVLKPYLGVQHDIAGLEAARRSLAEAIRAYGHGLYRVVLPPQEAVDTIHLVVVKVPLTALTVTGNKYFNEANIRASVPSLQVGQTPDVRQVDRDLLTANDNPAKHSAVQFKEDPNGGGIAANIDVADRDPWSITLGANNTGTPQQGGEARLTAYLQYANLFNMDQTIGLAYSTAPEDTSNVKQYGVYYKAPIYITDGFISASHSYSTTSTGALGSGQVITGAGTVDGIAYTQVLPSVGTYRSSVAVGFDDKLFRSPQFDGTALSGGNVRSTPISLTYVGNYDASWGTIGLNAELDTNGEAGSDNNAASYTANRAHADLNWTAFRAGYTLAMPVWRGFALNFRFAGQYTPDTLIQGEEFGIGGAASVRGAPERAVIGDEGGAGSIELYTPDLGYNVKLLAFSDNGFVIRHNILPGEPGKDALQSLGVGLRWSWRQAAQLAVDWGYIVHGANYPSVPTGSNRVSANLIYTFW